METFFQSHAYLVEHNGNPIRRSLMHQIDWTQKVIGIKGPRGVGKTSFLLQIAAERFDVHKRECLYVNMNSFYFQGRGLAEFAGDFVRMGGRTLLVDQVFKLTDWQNVICRCHERYPHLQIIYATTSVDVPEEDAVPQLEQIGRCYVLQGLSLRSYLGLQTQQELPSYTFEDIITNHEAIQKTILPKVRPWEHFRDYLHHGYYPFFLENRNFTENLLKAVNMMLEIDVLFIKQIELKYLAKLKKLLYLLAVDGATSPNVSKLADDIKTSRATVMNYLRNLEEARLIRLIYKPGESFPKKPALVMLHNTNLLYAVYANKITEQSAMETFFVNCFRHGHTVSKEKREGYYRIDGKLVCICDKTQRVKQGDEPVLTVRYNTELGRGADIPIWLFGFMQ